jgi:hypothetical protein
VRKVVPRDICLEGFDPATFVHWMFLQMLDCRLCKVACIHCCQWICLKKWINSIPYSTANLHDVKLLIWQRKLLRSLRIHDIAKHLKTGDDLKDVDSAFH